ncbi:hypothetical protein [Streptomyces sp. NBC_00582]|uniref:hypothetical protein n=1 Tax=Streptomyces sp. NBC_00582 TaxID=2975783 RepID=UPI002E81629C|nr:hypothetical protein [Streptomyces sp. NBC_00582]WUB60774.1 hypothetical protein OG852_10465 [Streptomyces sp. NBC_00582]
MRTAHGHACAALGTRPEPDADETWGWRGRTLSLPVIAANGPAWLRVGCAPSGEINATFWNGSVAAQQAIPESVPRPRLRVVHDWNDEQWTYRAELYERVTARPASPASALTTAPDLPSTWWRAVRAVLHDIAPVPTDRFTVHEPFLKRAMPQFLGTPIDTTPPSWSTAHGDFHWANLCAPELRIFDWEGWGLAPTGYDAAVLHSYSLLIPSVAACVRREMKDVLNTPDGRFAELAVITQILHSTTHGDNLDLAEPLRRRAEHLLGRPVPPPGGPSAAPRALVERITPTSPGAECGSPPAAQQGGGQAAI